MKRFRVPLIVLGLFALVVGVVLLTRTPQENLGGTIIDIPHNVDLQGHEFNVEIINPANPTISLEPGQHAIVTMPTEDPPFGQRLASPRDFTGARLSMYEFSADFENEKGDYWVGRSYNWGAHPNDLTEFLPGRTYYIKANSPETPRFFQSAAEPLSGYDIVIQRPGSSDITFGPAADDLQRALLLRDAVAQAQTGDTLILGDGRFDMDCQNRGGLRFPNMITVRGQGMDKTHLYANCYSDDQGPGFVIRSGLYTQLTFENQTWRQSEDGIALAMYDGTGRTEDNVHYARDGSGNTIAETTRPGPFDATIDHVRVVSNAWALYNWNSRGFRWTIRDSVIKSGRQGISMMSNGGEFTQSATITRTIFDIDTMRSRDIGWTSNRTHGGGYGLVARSGHITVEDSEFHLKCGNSPHVSSFIPRCAGVYDGHGFGSISNMLTFVTLNNNRWFVDGDYYGNRSPETFDIFMTNTGAQSRLVINGGCGSGTGCAVTKSWEASSSSSSM